jgi:predicted ArsR family transcriptional regulator
MAALEDDRQPGPRSASDRRAALLAELRADPRGLGVADLARRLGVHPNTVRLRLGALAAEGLVEEVPSPGPRGPGRPALAYRATRRMPRGPDRYRELAAALLDALVRGAGSGGAVAEDPEGPEDPDGRRDEPGARALEAGRAWGAQAARARDAGGGHARAARGADPSASEPASAPATGDGPAGGARHDDLARLMALLDDVGFAPEPAARGIALRQCPFLDLVDDQRMVVCRVHLGLMQGALAAWRSGARVDRLEPFVEPDLCLAHVHRAGRRARSDAS